MSGPELDLTERGTPFTSGNPVRRGKRSPQQNGNDSTDGKLSQTSTRAFLNASFDPTKQGSTHPFRRSVLGRASNEVSSLSVLKLIAIIMGIFIVAIGKPVAGILLIGVGLILK